MDITTTSEEIDPYFLQATLLVDSILDRAVESLTTIDRDLDNVNTLERGASILSIPVMGDASRFHGVPMETIVNIDWPSNQDFTQSVGETKIEEFVQAAVLLVDTVLEEAVEFLTGTGKYPDSLTTAEKCEVRDVRSEGPPQPEALIGDSSVVEWPSIQEFSPSIVKFKIEQLIKILADAVETQNPPKNRKSSHGHALDSISIKLGNLETKTWDIECSWLYCIDYLGVDDHEFDVRHRYRVRWSVPTRRKPIPRATACVYFTCSVSKVKPKTHSIDMLYVLEGSRLVHRPGQSRFREQWLKDIINNKAAMIKMVDF